MAAEQQTLPALKRLIHKVRSLAAGEDGRQVQQVTGGCAGDQARAGHRAQLQNAGAQAPGASAQRAQGKPG